MAKDWSRTKEYRELRENLTDSLVARGLVEPVYTDMVRRYLSLWCNFQELGDDIRERGVMIEDPKRGTMVENRSLVIRPQYDREMRAIFDDLGFRDLARKAPGVGEDDDVL